MVLLTKEMIAQPALSVCLVCDEQLAAEVGDHLRPHVWLPVDMLPPHTRMAPLQEDLDRWAAPTQADGRSICPHLQGAKDLGVVYVGHTPEPRTADELASLTVRVAEQLRMIHQNDRSGGRLASIVIDVEHEDPVTMSALVEEAHNLAKASVLRLGLLNGEFGPELRGGGSRYPHVETRRANGCYLAIRNLLRADMKYVAADPEWLAIFREWYPAEVGR